jgi:hypothetical protein
MDTDFGGHAYYVALLPGFLRGLQPIIRSLTAGAAPTSRKIRGAVMPDKMQQSSVLVFRSSVAGNCGNLRARTSCAPPTERADSTSCNICGRVDSTRNEHRPRCRMDSQDVASATDRPGEPRRALAAVADGTPVRPAPPGQVCRHDCDHRPGRLRLIGPGYYLNWLPQPRRFAYALR